MNKFAMSEFHQDLLPGRTEFGGVTTNLERELELSQITVHRNHEITVQPVEDAQPDMVVLAPNSKAPWGRLCFFATDHGCRGHHRRCDNES